MCIGELRESVEYVLGDVYALVNLVKCVLDDVSLFFVILVHLGISIDDVYFGENNEV